MDAAFRMLIALLQLTGMLVVLLAVLRLLLLFVRAMLRNGQGKMQPVRRQYTAALLLAFEILVGAGIVASALHPSWSDIGKLAAIAA
ncbi:MAG: DUF1622 domain-containing protein, partial [Sphingobacteriales bacterium]